MGQKRKGFDAILDANANDGAHEHEHEHPIRKWAKTRAGRRVIAGVAIGGGSAAAIGTGPGVGIPLHQKKKAKEGADERANSDQEAAKQAEEQSERARQQQAEEEAAKKIPPPPPEVQEQQRQIWDAEHDERERMALSDRCGHGDDSTSYSSVAHPCPGWRWKGGKWVKIGSPGTPN